MVLFARPDLAQEFVVVQTPLLESVSNGIANDVNLLRGGRLRGNQLIDAIKFWRRGYSQHVVVKSQSRPIA